MTEALAFHDCFEKVYDHGIPFIRPKSDIPYNEVVKRFDALTERLEVEECLLRT